MLPYILTALGAAVAGVIIALVYLSRRVAVEDLDVQGKVKRVKTEAERAAEQIIRTTELEVRQETLDMRNETEQELEHAAAALAQSELALASWEEKLDVAAADLAEWEQVLRTRTKAAETLKSKNRQKKKNAAALVDKRIQVLEERAGQTAKDVRRRLSEAMVMQFKADAEDRLRNLEDELGPESGRAAKRIMGVSIGRYDAIPAPQRTSSTLSLRPDDAAWVEQNGGGVLSELESLTGVKVIFDTLEGTIRVDSPNGVARELARRAVAKLFSGKRGAAARVKLPVLVRSLRKDLEQEVRDAGRRAFKLLGLKPAAPELVELVGQLRFRTSYSQNQYHHAVEAGILAGLMAAELGADIMIARRAALLHDIGKALTHEREGSHALIGGELAEKHGESAVVVNAIASHHDDRPAESVYARLVAASDAMSGARPGARRELVEAYVDRIKDLEHLARRFTGVSEAYAVQAGRELRVLVDENDTGDAQAADLAARIAAKVSEELVFPGQIKVTVIRAVNAVAVAS